MRSYDHSHGAIHEHQLGEACQPRVGERLTGHRRRAVDLPRCAWRRDGQVRSKHDVRVEHGEQRLEVTVARGSQKGFDHLTLAGEIRAGNSGRSLHPAACAAGELPCRGRRAPHDGSDLIEGHGEHIVQHEREPLGGSQRFEHHEQRETDRVGQQGFMLGGSPVSRGSTTGSGTCASRGSSRRDLRERSISRHTRATTVVSHPPRFSMPPVSERLRRSQASWTASSASLSEPSIR